MPAEPRSRGNPVRLCRALDLPSLSYGLLFIQFFKALQEYGLRGAKSDH